VVIVVVFFNPRYLVVGEIQDVCWHLHYRFVVAFVNTTPETIKTNAPYRYAWMFF
jgi:hypothetical protein